MNIANPDIPPQIRASQFDPGRFFQLGDCAVFRPTYINTEWVWDDERTLALEREVHRRMVEVQGLTSELCCLEDLKRVVLLNEAYLSCKMSAIIPHDYTFCDVLAMSDDVKPEHRLFWSLVNNNYMNALETYAANVQRQDYVTLEQGGLINTQLLDNTPFQNRETTQYRFRRNHLWLSPAGSMGTGEMREALYIAPEPHKVLRYMQDMHTFWRTENRIPYLLKVAVIFAQTAAIIPYTHGTQVTARFLITAAGIARGVYPISTVCLSGVLIKNYAEYQQRLNAAKEPGKFLEWIEFFMRMMLASVESKVESVKAVAALQQEMLDVINKQPERLAGQMRSLMQVLFRHPVISITEATRMLDLSRPTTSKLFLKFQHLGWIKEVTGGTHNRLFHFQRDIELFDEHTDPLTTDH